ncbi:MAG: hypothetical protein HEQ23_04295 [Tepidisphaera sp.]
MEPSNHRETTRVEGESHVDRITSLADIQRLVDAPRGGETGVVVVLAKDQRSAQLTVGLSPRDGAGFAIWHPPVSQSQAHPAMSTRGDPQAKGVETFVTDDGLANTVPRSYLIPRATLIDLIERFHATEEMDQRVRWDIE